MCGFVGFTGAGALPDADAVLHKMTDRIAHRGPDDASYYADGEVALGFRRLSIIDLDGGRQPLFNEDGSLVLVFNGEIYNYRELRRELLKAGHTFSTKTDSEVLLHGYEEYGEDLPRRLRGMFAFVIWDKNRRRLFGARDYFGIKPFYYAKMNGAFMFGSEIKSFLDHPLFSKELNLSALEGYLSFWYSPPGEDTFFKGVHKLPAAHCFTYEDGEMRLTRYWRPEFEADESKTLEEWADEISRVFDDSVAAHKIADVEVGSFLSSGVDSSYITCSANVAKTFTVGYSSGDKYDEVSYAKELSEHLGARNTAKLITPEEYWAVLPKIQYHMDEPLADPAAVALYFVCNTASKQLKVVMSGEGSDELFGGYNVYGEPMTCAWYDKIPLPVRRAIGKAAERLPHVRGLNFLVRRGKPLEERFIGSSNVFSEAERKRLLKIQTDAPSPASVVAPYYAEVADKDGVTKMQYVDIHSWLPGDILLKADKMSMANSLEVRVPFLDREVMDVARRIPARYRVSKENTKLALREAARRRMPEKWAGKRKLGFPVPIRVWLREEPYYSTVKAAFESPDAERFFHTERLLKLLDEHKSGRVDNFRRIWTVYSFLVWYKVYFGSDNVVRPEAGA